MKSKYEADEAINEIKEYSKKLAKEFSIQIEERDELVAQMNIKRKEINQFSDKLDRFNFYEKDKEMIETGVDDIEESISELNSLSYKLEYQILNLKKSIKNKFSFNLGKIEKIFQESQILFPNQLKKEYSDLIKFNSNLTEERNRMLQATLSKKDEELSEIRIELKSLNNKKEELLSFIQDTSVFKKFKGYQKEQISLEAELQVLGNKLEIVDKLIEKDKKLVKLKENQQEDIDGIKEELQSTEANEFYNEIRGAFSDYYKGILGEDAYISWSVNDYNNVDFNQPKVLNKSNKKDTAQGKGYTYSKLFCVCFDLAVLTSYSKQPYYKFVYHDDVLANEDDGVKHRLIELVKDLADKFDFQYLLSTIKSDLPIDINGEIIYFNKEEIVLELNDIDDSGTLFNFKF